MSRHSKVAALALAAIVVAATPTASAKSERVSQGKVKMTFIIPELANPFYVPSIKGARLAAKKYNVDLQVVGTQQFDAQQQIALLDDALAAGTRAIVAVPGSPTALNNEIAKAKGKGVDVHADLDQRPDVPVRLRDALDLEERRAVSPMHPATCGPWRRSPSSRGRPSSRRSHAVPASSRARPAPAT